MSVIFYFFVYISSSSSSFTFPSLVPLTLTFSLVTCSLTLRVSVTGFFFTATSSLTYGCFVTSTSSFFNGTLVSVLDCTGLSAAVLPLAGLLSTDISSCVTGTSTVLVSVTGSFVIVASLVDSLLDASNLSSVICTVVSSAFLAAAKPSFADDDEDGGESLK